MSYEEGSKEFEEACTDRAVGLLARNNQLQADLAAANERIAELGAEVRRLTLKLGDERTQWCKDQRVFEQRIAELEGALEKYEQKSKAFLSYIDSFDGIRVMKNDGVVSPVLLVPKDFEIKALKGKKGG